MKKFGLILLVLAVLTALSAPVFAGSATTTAEPQADIAPIQVDSLTQFSPKASVGKLDGEDAKLPTAYLFDSSSETRLNVTVSPISPFEVSTSTSVTGALAAFGVIVNGEEGTTVEIKVYGSNDAYSDKWNHLLLDLGGPEVIGDYYVFRVSDQYIAQYCYYRFEFTAEGCGDIIITELAMFKSEDKGPELEWDYTLEEPKLVPVGTVGQHAPVQLKPRKLLINRFFSFQR